MGHSTFDALANLITNVRHAIKLHFSSMVRNEYSFVELSLCMGLSLKHTCLFLLGMRFILNYIQTVNMFNENRLTVNIFYSEILCSGMNNILIKLNKK